MKSKSFCCVGLRSTCIKSIKSISFGGLPSICQTVLWWAVIPTAHYFRSAFRWTCTWRDVSQYARWISFSTRGEKREIDSSNHFTSLHPSRFDSTRRSCLVAATVTHIRHSRQTAYELWNVIKTNLFQLPSLPLPSENYVRFPLANLIQSFCTHQNTGCQLK